MNANTVPLKEVIPWCPTSPRKILVCDSVETDGSFVLSTMTADLFSSTVPSSLPPSSTSLTKGSNRRTATLPRALWLSGNTSTERQVALTLKKLGCDAGAAYLRKTSNENSDQNNFYNGLKIRSLALETADLILSSSKQEINANNRTFDEQRYLKTVYNDVKAWVNASSDNSQGEDEVMGSALSWIILDDVTTLASILGDKLVYCFVESLILLCSRTETTSARQCGLIIRCSGDLDQMLYRMEGNEGNDHSGWFGAGGLSHKHTTHEMMHRTPVPWERAIEESVDAIIDVLPLLSGFSREAHGRLIFSETPNGQGWKELQSRNSRNLSSSQPPGLLSKSTSRTNETRNSNWNKLIFNYRLQDNGARAIRLRS